MVKLICIIVILSICSCDQISKSIPVLDSYNKEKTAMIMNALKDEKPIDIKVFRIDAFDDYHITFKELRLDVTHRFTIPYKSVEHWEYSGKTLDGKNIILETTNGVAKHRVSDECYKAMRDYCLSIKITSPISEYNQVY